MKSKTTFAGYISWLCFDGILSGEPMALKSLSKINRKLIFLPKK